MEFDKRILQDKKPLTCLDAEDAMQFTGTECYLSDFAHQFEDLDDIENSDCISTYKKGILTRVDCSGREEAFESVGRTVYKYCLPVEWVKKPEKKFRPYKDVEEFFNDVGCTLGDVIRFRKKDTTEEEYHTLLTGFKGNARVNIGLGDGGYYSLSDLFSLFELYTADGWRPFGIEE